MRITNERIRISIVCILPKTETAGTTFKHFGRMNHHEYRYDVRLTLIIEFSKPVSREHHGPERVVYDYINIRSRGFFTD